MLRYFNDIGMVEGMDDASAVTAFAALSQETRLSIVRLLVTAGERGKAAGEIAEAVRVSPSNVSFHLKELEHAGLVRQRRESRSIIYSVSYEALRDLIGFLMEDCCSGHPEIRAPVTAGACRPVRAT